MQKKALLWIISLFSLATSISGIYLPLFYLSRGFQVSQIIVLLALTFGILATVPFFFAGKNTLSLGVLTFSVFCLVASSGDPILAGILYGLSLALFWPAYNYLSLKVTSSEDRGEFLGTVSAIRTGVPIVGAVLGGFLAKYLGLSSLLLISSLLHFASFFLSSKFLSEVPSEDVPREEFRLPFADQNFLSFMGVFFLTGFADSTWLVYPLLIAKLANGQTGEMGLASGAITLLGALLFVAIGKLSDRFGGKKRFLLISPIFESLWFFLASIAKSVSEIVAFSLSSGVASALMRTADSLYADSYEKRHHAFLTAVREAAINLGRLASILILSQVIISGDYSLYYRIFALAALLYLPLFLRIRERHNYA